MTLRNTTFFPITTDYLEMKLHFPRHLIKLIYQHSLTKTSNIYTFLFVAANFPEFYPLAGNYKVFSFITGFSYKPLAIMSAEDKNTRHDWSEWAIGACANYQQNTQLNRDREMGSKTEL